MKYTHACMNPRMLLKEATQHDILLAIYLYCRNYHGGQACKKYSVMCKLRHEIPEGDRQDTDYAIFEGHPLVRELYSQIEQKEKRNPNKGCDLHIIENLLLFEFSMRDLIRMGFLKEETV